MRYLLPFVALFAFGCGGEPKVARLDKGTEVPLILMQQLSAGGSQVGEEVAFMLTEDLKAADGSVLVPRGAIAYGRVSWSRSAGALSKITNEPPRLAITVDRTTSIDKRTVLLEVTEDGEPYQFSQKNTSPIRASAGIDQALKDDQTKSELERLFRAFEGDSMGDERVIRELAEKLGLKSTEKMAREHSIRDIESIVKQIVQGEATRVVGGQTTLIIDTIAELAGLRFSVGDRIAGVFRGPTIHAYPGTPVTAYVAEDMDIRID
jgi:hypothetical protein